MTGLAGLMDSHARAHIWPHSSYAPTTAVSVFSRLDVEDERTLNGTMNGGWWMVDGGWRGWGGWMVGCSRVTMMGWLMDELYYGTRSGSRSGREVSSRP